MGYREPRFPGIDWYCDNCNAYLNSQDDFDDHHYIWKCRECGYKNSISRDNIMWQSKFIKPLGYFLSWSRSVLVYLFVGLIIQLVSNIEIPFTSFLVKYWMYTLGGYVLLDVVSMIFEKEIAKYCRDMKLSVYIITTPFVNLLGDLARPYIELFKSILGIIGFVKNKNIMLLITKIFLGILYGPIVVYIIMFILNFF